jgi:hypothetical protein
MKLINTIAAVLIVSGTAAAQSPTTKRSAAPPTSRPAAAPINMGEFDANARQLLLKGIAAIEAGTDSEAVATLTEAANAYGKTISTVNDTMVRAAVHHALAVAYFRAGDVPKARQWMEKALNAKWTHETLVYNAAAIAASGKTTVNQALGLLEPYLNAHAEADEKWVDLYGMALQKALSEKNAAKRLEPKVKARDRFVARLESNNPGKHRWGTEWVDNGKWAEIQKAKKIADENLGVIQRHLDYAARDLQDAQAGYDNARRQYILQRERNANASDSSVVYAQNRLNDAQAAVNRYQAEYDRADKGPQPKWDGRIVTVVPVAELVKE